jgi:glycosyltransferase involved in cell wall biosynthesis
VNIAIDTLYERGDSNSSSAVDYLVNLGTHLPQAGPQHEYYMLVSPRSAHRYRELVRDNVHLVNCLFANDRRLLRIVAQQTVVPLRLHRLGVDALFAAGNVCPLVGDFCRILKINTLHHFRTPKLIGRTRSLYRTVAFGAAARAADCILANSSVTRDDICQFLKVDAGKVKTVWEAVDECFVPASLDSQRQVLERFNLRPSFLLFCSTLWPYKNAHVLIRAYGLAVRRHNIEPDLIFVGREDKASYKAQLDAIVQEEGLQERVRFLGVVPNRDMPPLYSAASMLVFPSLSETFGKPLVEAMLCDLPVIASNVSCIPEILGGAGLLIDPNDVEEMATAIYRLLTDQALRTSLIERGRQRGRCFSWPKAAQETLEIIENTHAKWRRDREAK